MMRDTAETAVIEHRWNELRRAGDTELVQQLRRGNDDALAVMVDRYQRLVFSVALRIVKDEGEAEDVVQSVFLEVFRNAGQFDPERGSLKMWLLQYAYGASINRRHHLERRQFYSRLELDETVPSQDLPSYLGCHGLTPAETGRLVEQAFEVLSRKQRKAIEAIYFQGLKFVEAAEKTGESLPALRHNYYRGLMRLREFIMSGEKPRVAVSPVTRNLGTEVGPC